MRVKLNRDTCDKPLNFCERCLGRFLKYPMGYERTCFEEIIEDDGSDDLTLEVTTGGKTFEMTLDDEARKLIGGEGWALFVDEDVPFFRA